MKSAVVTGAGGFVGSWLVRELTAQGTEVYAAVSESPQQRDIRMPGVHTLRCGMADYRLLPKMLNGADPEVFYHLAWTGVSGPARGSAESQLNNAAGAVKAAEAAAALGCRRFVGMGSIAERETAAAMALEGSRPSPDSLAGAGKFFAHCATKTRCAQLGIEHVWPMLTNAYGEGERSVRLINDTIRKILMDEPLEFTAGTQLYDFIHAADAARALRLLGCLGRPFCSYVVGSGLPRPLREYLEELGGILAPGRELKFGSLPYTGAKLSPEAFDTAALVKDTGFSPEISFAEGVRRTFRWIKENG
ncbi:NAD-dependent epimerase/dehydratase family protein [Papillibacter cinnamivorans]|uniref:Nucleoside-diphosphate-sugar epimerase n=1 Tax=Papillibacter cinnamivorans DSM 12816 TaxID=1122930 RepID=A0A1W2CCL4_9FIRM|nr:NAD(P)-dependent oxidoreductase [Papillibacter cinnamivorans]SMC83007.1 Nucleoside-diphosphate-sugar epimerase [Papillibacter cinnamivorans DSM 12816]